MNETLVYLPFSRPVVVQVFATANYLQKAVFTPKSGSGYTATGNGGENKEIGHWSLLTGPPEAGKEGFLVKVTIENQLNGVWRPSLTVLGRRYSVAGFNAIFIASEDSTDQDWNDCLAMFSWTTPPVAEQGDPGPAEPDSSESQTD